MELGHHNRFGMSDSIERTPILDDRLRFPAPRLFCKCGCGEEIYEIEHKTHENEPVATVKCLDVIAELEGWDKPGELKEAV